MTKIIFHIFINRRILSRLMVLILTNTLIVSMIAQEFNAYDSAPLFLSDEVVYLTIKGDIRTLLRDSDDEREEHPLFIEYEENGNIVRLDVLFQVRGNFRRKPQNCNFPPLKLNFKKKQVKNTLFHNIDKVKLVTHCQSNSKKYAGYVVEEYMVYRTFNMLTDTGYRVRLAYISYEDTVSGLKTEESYAFFIEPDDVLEDRLQAREINSKYFLQDRTHLHHMSKLAVFQYMVGNTDWAVTTLHNIKLFSVDSTQPPYAIPYDFDWCGLVSTVYARPLPKFGTDNVKTRVFRGYCRSLEQFKKTFSEFHLNKDNIYKLYDEFELLDKRDKKRIYKYLDEFYDIIEHDRAIKSEFMDACLKENNY
nr:hypothetical protein [Bacteroidota bacterium]